MQTLALAIVAAALQPANELTASSENQGSHLYCGFFYCYLLNSC